MSHEGALGPIDLTAWLGQTVHWVIAGGESASGARPSDPAHIRFARDQCVAASVPFFLQAVGGLRPSPGGRQARDDRRWDAHGPRLKEGERPRAGRPHLGRVPGVTAAGRGGVPPPAPGVDLGHPLAIGCLRRGNVAAPMLEARERSSSLLDRLPRYALAPQRQHSAMLGGHPRSLRSARFLCAAPPRRPVRDRCGVGLRGGLEAPAAADRKRENTDWPPALAPARRASAAAAKAVRGPRPPNWRSF